MDVKELFDSGELDAVLAGAGAVPIVPLQGANGNRAVANATISDVSIEEELAQG